MTTKNMKPLMILPYEPGCIQLSQEQADSLFTKEEQAADYVHGKREVFGPWAHTIRYNALVTSNTFFNTKYYTERGPLMIYGKRQLSRCHTEDYELCGQVSLGGKKYRAFTSTQMFRLPNGHLVNVATIHAVGAAKDSESNQG